MGFNVNPATWHRPVSGLRDGTDFRDRSVLHAFNGTPTSSGLFPLVVIGKFVSRFPWVLFSSVTVH